MPRPTLPPTPGSSSDIKGKDGIQQLASLQLAFELPPPALHDADPSHISKAHAKLSPTSPGSNYPMQAAEAVKARRRSTVSSKESKDGAFSLPPPPTRSRKIIQMKPRTQEVVDNLASAKAGGNKAAKDAAKTSGGAASAASPTASSSVNSQGNKKKQPSATSAAGRKIARKTAHSLIERRRRSKMNEEFALLKSMIPACTGEMHKLAILQASIEYVRYLEDCVAKLKAQEVESKHERSEVTPLPSIRDFHPTLQGDNAADAEMTDSEAPSPDFAPNSLPASSTIPAQDSYHRHPSYSPASTDQRHYSYSHTTTTSPAFGPQQHVPGYFQGYASASGSTLTSPALLAQSDPDQEATAALLMLNSSRGRPTVAEAAAAAAVAKGSGRGMSVRDLLSS